MIHIRELPTLEKLEFEYDFTVYDPHYTSPDPIFICDALIRKAPHSHLRLLDLGCGSGVLGLSMKYLHPQLDVTLCDTDKNAIKWAKYNSKRLNLPAHIVKSDMFSKVGKFDIIITTLPSFKENTTSQPDHTVVDPDLALYRRLFEEAPSPIIVCEVNPDRQSEVVQLTKGWKEILKTDYAYGFLRKRDIQKPHSSEQNPAENGKTQRKT